MKPTLLLLAFEVLVLDWTQQLVQEKLGLVGSMVGED